jgi:hypothetical protein
VKVGVAAWHHFGGKRQQSHGWFQGSVSYQVLRECGVYQGHCVLVLIIRQECLHCVLVNVCAEESDAVSLIVLFIPDLESQGAADLTEVSSVSD